MLCVQRVCRRPVYRGRVAAPLLEVGFGCCWSSTGPGFVVFTLHTKTVGVEVFLVNTLDYLLVVVELNLDVNVGDGYLRVDLSNLLNDVNYVLLPVHLFFQLNLWI